MTIIASKQDGAWDTGATWVGNVAPTDGDTAKVSHDVYIRTNITVGPDTGTDAYENDPAGFANASIVVMSGGLCRFEEPVTSDYTLTLKGPILVLYGGEFRCGSESTPIPAARTTIIDFGQGSYEFESRIIGKLTLWGQPAYHMGAADKQRTKLLADVTANPGTPVQFQVNSDVDWEVGDTVWVETGGDPAHAITDCEEITIATKVNASTYTADFAFNHYADGTYGDNMIHGERNLIIRGGSETQGFNIRLNSEYTITRTGQFDIAWVRFEYASKNAQWDGAGLAIYCGANTKLAQSVDDVKIRNCLFWKSGDTNGVAIYFYVWHTNGVDENYENISEIHTWNFRNYSVHFNTNFEQIRLGHISSFGNGHGHGTYGGTNYADVRIKGFWYSRGASGSYHGLSNFTVSVEDFEIHSCHYGVHAAVQPAPAGEMTGTQTVYKNGEVFHAALYSVYHAPGSGIVCDVVFEDVHFWNSKSGLRLLGGDRTTTVFRRCKFDAQQYDDSISGAGFVVYEGGQQSTFYFDECDFGLNEQNYKWNFFVREPCMEAQGTRFIFHKCKFKKPQSFQQTNPAYDWIEEEWQWSVWGGNPFHNWTYLARINPLSSYEMVECEILNNSDVDQWDTLFPNCDRVALTSGGVQVRKTPDADPNGYYDGTYQRTFYPLMGGVRIRLNAVPIRIPVTEGQTISVKLSFKKDISQPAHKRPGVHLVGCGLDEEDIMSDVIDTWEEVEVGGVAQWTGVVEFYPSLCGVSDPYESMSGLKGPTTWYTSLYPNYYKYRGVQGGGNGNLKLYADKLDITIT
jgi:hypothetical protein